MVITWPKYNENEELNYLTVNQIQALIERKRIKNTELAFLNDYYLGKNRNIQLKNTQTESEKENGVTKPNNKIAHPFAYTITSMIVGYLMGENVRYVLPDDTNQLIIDKIMEYNDEESVNMSIAIDQSKYGYASEQLYLDENASIRFNNISNYDIIFIQDNNIDNDLWCVIKFRDQYDMDGINILYTDVEVFYEDKIITYKNNFIGMEESENPFHDVPFILYQNNDDFICDYARVLDLIDMYDKVESSRVDDVEYFSDAFLKVLGVDIDEDEAIKMKKLKIFASNNENAKIDYVTKGATTEDIQKLIEQIIADIHKFTLTPDINSEAFLASNASGTALKLKFQGMEFLCGIKEGYLRKGLKRRIELINNILNLKTSKDVDLVSDTKIVFTRNTVSNIEELVNQVNQLSGIISREGQIEMLGSLIDSQLELDRLEETKEDLFTENNLNDNTNNNEKENDGEK